MGRSRTSPTRLRTLQRREHALRARQQGRTFAQIGDELGISAQAAHRLVLRALQAWARQVDAETDALLALELSRLDALHQKLWAAFFEEGRLGVATHLLRIMDRRVRLLGIAPVQRDPDLGDSLDLPELHSNLTAEQAAQQLLSFLEARSGPLAPPKSGDDDEPVH